MAKVTKELIEQLIVEELESLSEEELNEISPLAGLGAGIKSAAGALGQQFAAGRAQGQAKALGKKYHKAMTKALKNLNALSQKMNAEFTKVGDKNPLVKDLVKDFSPVFNNSLNALNKKHAQLAQIAAGPAPEAEAAPAQGGGESGQVATQEELRAGYNKDVAKINKDQSMSDAERAQKLKQVAQEWTSYGLEGLSEEKGV